MFLVILMNDDASAADPSLQDRNSDDLVTGKLAFSDAWWLGDVGVISSIPGRS